MALVLGLFMSGPVLAQTPTEGQALGRQLAHEVFVGADFRGYIEKAATDTSDLEDIAEARPEWLDFMREAMLEELDHDMPALEQILGDAFAGVFTDEELRAGLKIFGDPAFKAQLKASVAGDPPPSVKLSRETEKLIRSRTGTTFLEKIEHLDDIIESVQGDLFGEIMPGVMRRFADKAEAGEARRRAEREGAGR